MHPTVATFKACFDYVRERFVYVSDQEQYQLGERWSELRQVSGGKLAGDCEDFAITILNRAANQGVDLNHLVVYLVAVGLQPDHIVCGVVDPESDDVFIADCNEPRLGLRSWDTYYRYVSERKLSEGVWRQI